MSQEYTHQVLKIVVAQICQTIGWHSIHSTPLELLADILHKYLQEIARQTARYTEFYGRTEPSLDDIALAFRDLNVNLSDVEEYVNNVEPISCAIDVPRYPVHKESNLNFLKPGSKEVLTRPVHIYEYLPPIYPEKEATSEHEQNDTENSCDNVILHNNSHEIDIFKKPEITENNPVYKKPRLAFEEEGRPTREISSVMMTSSGFISPAREGKLPDSKIPIIPEIKSSNRKSPSPSPSNLNSSSTQLTPLPVSSMESKFDKKIKRKSNVLGAAAGGSGEKERKREKGSSRNVTLSATSLSTKSINSTNHHREGGHHHIPDKQKVLTKKKNKEKKHKDHQTNMNNVSSERSIGNNSVLNNESSKNSKFNLNSSNINQKTDYFSQSSFNAIPANTAVIDINVKSKVDKLSAEPDKQKLNIFKKISAKKDRDDLSKSPNIYPDNQILSSIPEGTTITPAPPLIKNHSQSKISESEHVICLDDEPSMTISKITSNSKLSHHQAANIISQNLEALGTTAIPTTSKPQTTRKPRKNKGHHQQQQQLEQAMPLNLSNSSPVNMVKKDILQNSKLPYSTSHKTPKGKKERKNKTKQKESKKDAQQSNVLQDFPNVKNALNSLQPVFPSTSSESHSRSDNPFLPNKDIKSLNQQYRKFDSMMKQGVAPPSQPYGASNFPSIPTIPMFPFYSFPSRPGLIPSPSLFSPLPDNSSFKPYMPIIRFDFDKVNKKPRLGSKYDEDPVPLPPPLPPTEAEKGYCNVAPLVPDSMKFQLLPQKYPSSTVTTSNQKSAGITPTTSTSSLYNEFGNGLSSAPMSSNFSDQSQLQHPPTSSGNMNTSNTVSGMHQRSPKFSSDIPIEISDDEKPKSDTDENISSKNGTLIDDTNLNTDKTSANSSYMDDYPCSSTAKSLKNEKSENSSPDRSIVATSSIREEKHEKRKDKEHKKGKKGKDGKIKKKKDKKDKSKNKDKTGKRKDREEKKDKDKTKKLKKEKKKEKLKAAAIYSSDDGGKQLNDSGDCSGAVPKLTLKFGLNNSPQHSPDERKMSLKNERRESSPELARISPLVTRPPKQKNLKEKNSDNEQSSTISSMAITTLSASTSTATGKNKNNSNTSGTGQQQISSSSSITLTSTPASISSSSIVHHTPTPQPVSRGPGRPPKSSKHKNNSNHPNCGLNSSSSSLGGTVAVASSLNTAAATITINENSTGSHLIERTTNKSGVHSTDAEGNQVWICPACGRVDDGTPMIGCDGCDAWYHWVCVGIQVPPDDNEDWYCRVCIVKKQEAHGVDKKRKRKKKNKAN